MTTRKVEYIIINNFSSLTHFTNFKYFSQVGNEDLFKICINELNKYIKKIRTKYFFPFLLFFASQFQLGKEKHGKRKMNSS